MDASRCLVPSAWKRSRANALAALQLKRPDCFDKPSVVDGTGMTTVSLTDLEDERTPTLAEAHVIRMIAPFRPELSVRHHHNVDFQMVDCLKGWFQTDFEGVGSQRLEAGSSWVQPAGIRHKVNRVVRRLRAAGDQHPGAARDGERFLRRPVESTNRGCYPSPEAVIKASLPPDGSSHPEEHRPHHS
jgi:hypothetical protein